MKLAMLGLILILVGIVAPTVGYMLPSLNNNFMLTTVIIDTTEPSFLGTDPSDGATYGSLTTVSAHVKDEVSGVAIVYLYIDDGDMIRLNLESGTVNDGVWKAQINPLQSGTHKFEWGATDNAGNNIEFTGTFKIYSELQGDWYINNRKITSSVEPIYLRSRTLTFKFIKTGGTANVGDITCKVTYSGAESGTAYLAYEQDLGYWVWTKPSEWTEGKYEMSLSASDGVGTVGFSVNVQIGGEAPIRDWKEYINILTIAGVVLVLLNFIVEERE